MIRYERHGKNAGFISTGTGYIPAPPPEASHETHMIWLVSQLEMPGGWGQIQNCRDRAVMSGGILHHTAVLPRAKKQGSLWGLVARCQSDRLEEKIASAGWVVSHGYLYGASHLVSTEAIAEEVCGSSNGVVPLPGEPGHANALEWAQAFSEMLADPKNYKAQKGYALLWLQKRNRKQVAAAYRRLSNNAQLEDLVMCVYHAFSANAPSIAGEVLEKVLAGKLLGMDFAKSLLKEFATSPYGHWAHRDDQKSRFDRTVKAVKQSRIWPVDLVREVLK